MLGGVGKRREGEGGVKCIAYMYKMLKKTNLIMEFLKECL